MSIQLPSRRQTAGSTHTCELAATVNGKRVDLSDESVCRQLNLPEGTVFVCEATVSRRRDGKDVAEPCGRQHRLRYPRSFQWRPVRAVAQDSNGNGSGESDTED